VKVGLAKGGTLAEVVVKEVPKRGVGRNRDSQYEFVAGIAALVPFGFAHEHTCLLRGTVYCEVAGEAAGAGFGTANEGLIYTNREQGTEKFYHSQDRGCLGQGVAEFFYGQ
jgi:hypothetical protein